MGTDITMFIEKRNKEGKWENTGLEGYEYRNYDLFSWLSDVRNGNKNNLFDTTKTFRYINPSSFANRGIPDDTDIDERGYLIDCYGWGYCTLAEMKKELEDIDRKSIKYRAIVSFDIYDALKKAEFDISKVEKYSFCMGSSGCHIHGCDVEKYRAGETVYAVRDYGKPIKINKEKVEEENLFVNVLVDFHAPLKEQIEGFIEFVDKIVDRFKDDLDNVRLLFCYDC